MVFDPQIATGRTMPAEAAVAPRAGPVAAKYPNATSSPSPIPEVPPGASRELGPIEATDVPLAIALPTTIPRITAPTRTETMAIDPLSDRERAFVYLLRDVDKAITLGTLSPLERATMQGAKVMFDQLSVECERMLARKVSDLVCPVSKLAAEPDLGSSRTVAPASDRPTDAPKATAVPSSGVAAPASEGGSLTERLARLESRLEQLTRIIH